MKIYARTYDNELARFAGKDVWVKVKEKNPNAPLLNRRGNDPSEYLYIRVLGMHPKYSDIIQCNAIEAKYIDDCNENNDGNVKQILNFGDNLKVYNCPASDFILYHPTEVVTKEDLEDMVELNWYKVFGKE